MAKKRVRQGLIRGGLFALAVTGMMVSQPRAAHSDGEDKVTICHIPPGNPANRHTITVGAPAVPYHILLHGDFIGECDAPPPS